MTKSVVLVLAVLLLATVAASAAPEAEPPDPATTVTVSVGGSSLTLWPYTFQEPKPQGTPSDPINLVFLGTDPRVIRRALMGLGPSPKLGCVWLDGMGYEQAAWAETGGWVGGEVQLACSSPDKPLGSPFRLHLRLFRQGALTLGAAHFELNIPHTAEHEALAWDFARDLVTYDMGRAGAAVQAPVGLLTQATFGTVQRAIYSSLCFPVNQNGMCAGAGVTALFVSGLPLSPPAGTGPIPIPTSGRAYVIDASQMVAPDPVQSQTVTVVDVPYDITLPKPFCAGPSDYIHLSDNLHLELRVHTNPSGMYERTYVVSGTLLVTPLGGGPEVPAQISEYHRALLTDNYGEVTQQLSQTLLGDPPQSMTSTFSAGQVDEFSFATACGAP